MAFDCALAKEVKKRVLIKVRMYLKNEIKLMTETGSAIADGR